MQTKFFSLAAALATTASAFDCTGPYFSFYNRAGNALSYQRLDPALYPGVQSPHLHTFDGGNALAASMDFAKTQSSSCTTARIKPDKSLYWRPTLFWNGNNTGFYRVPDKFVKLYYKFGDGNQRANVTEFPEDFAMIAGNPFLRQEDTTSELSKGAAVKWSCKGENYQSIDAKGFPKGFTSCQHGLTSELTFPACWNGVPLDPKKPTAHMAYPTVHGEGINACPEGFKVARFPTIFVEFWYDVSAFDGHYSVDSVPWVLANGDPTGHGFHADFRNGWEKGVLAKATAETGYCNCGCGCGEDEMRACFGVDQVNSVIDKDFEKFESCSATPEFPGDDQSPLDKLPGCNPLQYGPEMATPQTGEGCVTAPVTDGGVPSSTGATSPPVTEGGVPSSTGATSPPVTEGGVPSSTGASPPESTTFSSTVSTTSTPQSTAEMSALPIDDGDAVVDGSPTQSSNLPTKQADIESSVERTTVTITSCSSTTSMTSTTSTSSESSECTSTVTVLETITVSATATSGHHQHHRRHGHI